MYHEVGEQFACGRCKGVFEGSQAKEEVWQTGSQLVCPKCYDEWQLEELASFDRTLGIKKWKDMDKYDKSDMMTKVSAFLLVISLFLFLLFGH